MDGSITTRGKCRCGGSFVFDRGRRDLFCDKCDARATGTYVVRFGKGKNRHYKSFGHNIEAAIQHLDHIRCQRGNPEVYGKYDPRDWQKHNPLSIAALGEAWVRKKKATKPPLTLTRMGMITNSIMRLTEHIDMNGSRLGDRSIKTLTDMDLELFYTTDHRKLNNPKEELSSKTLFDTCNTLNEFFVWAAKMAGCEPIKFSDLGYERNETEPITIQQQVALVEWVKENCPEPKIWFAIEGLARNPNIRPSAFCYILWEHISPTVGRIYVYRRKSRRKIKQGAPKPKIVIMSQEMMDYIKSIEWGTGPFMTYTTQRSGVKIGQRIHPKVLNIWVKKAGKALGIDTTLYAATKHTSVTGIKAYMDDEAIRRGFSQHATEDAYMHYQHDQLTDQIRAQKAYDQMLEDAKSKLKVVK
jgi:hypothetical protein